MCVCVCVCIRMHEGTLCLMRVCVYVGTFIRIYCCNRHFPEIHSYIHKKVNACTYKHEFAAEGLIATPTNNIPFLYSIYKNGNACVI